MTVTAAELTRRRGEYGIDAPYVPLWMGVGATAAIAVYIVAFNRSGRLFVNGHYMREVGSLREPLPLNWNRSQYLVMPPSQGSGPAPMPRVKFSKPVSPSLP